VSRLAAKLRQAELDAEAGRKILEAVQQADTDDVQPDPFAKIGDQARMRGVPCLGRGVGGTMRGTSPLGELIRRENQRERRRS
jgi:hypothetical protein